MNEFDPSAVSLGEWRSVAEASIKGLSLANLDRRTEDGLAVKALYSSADLPEELPLLGQPGWTIAQEIEPARDRAALNRMLLDEFSGGVGRVDLPAQSDPMNLPDALAGVETGAVGFGFAPGCDWRKAGEALSRLGRADGAGAEQRPMDSLGADPVLPAFHGGKDESDALAKWVQGEGSGLAGATMVAVAGDEYHLLGLTPAQELATVLASTAHVLRRFEAGGAAPATALEGMEWRFAGEADLYGTIAKARAMTLTLGQLADSAGGDPAGIGARVHGVTSARHLSLLDPETNILRNGTALLGMVLGGAGMITVRPHDWLTGASPAATRLARNAHHLLAAEGRLASVADPASGSYFLERLTGDLARHAWGLFQTIEAAGGVAECAPILDHWAAEAAGERERAVDEGRENLLGVTVHPAPQDSPTPAPVAEGAFGPRGGPKRPSRGWEQLRAETTGKSLRCLLVDLGDGGEAEACRRWFEVVGLAPVAMRCDSGKEAREAIASAGPDILVVGGTGDPGPYGEAAGKACRVIAADAFGGDCRTLMRDLVDAAMPEGAS